MKKILLLCSTLLSLPLSAQVPGNAGGTRVRLFYEELEEPKASGVPGDFTQASKTVAIVINPDGKEKTIDLGAGKHLKLKVTPVGAYRNVIEIEPEAAGQTTVRPESR